MQAFKRGLDLINISVGEKPYQVNFYNWLKNRLKFFPNCRKRLFKKNHKLFQRCELHLQTHFPQNPGCVPDLQCVRGNLLILDKSLPQNKLI